MSDNFASDLLGKFSKELDEDEIEAIKDSSECEEALEDTQKEDSEEDVFTWESK